MHLNQLPGYTVVRLHVIAVVALLLSALTAAPAIASSGESGVHFTRVVVEPAGSDFHVTVYYNASIMTKVFSVLFGTGVLESAVTDEVSSFGNLTLESINTNDGIAKFTMANQSEYSDGWYMYDNNARFPISVEKLEICGSTLDRPIIVNDATEVPDFFYQ